MNSHTTPHATPYIWNGTTPADIDPDNACKPYLCIRCSRNSFTLCSYRSLVLGHDVEFFSDAGFDLDRINIRRNAPVAQLYEDAIMNEGAVIGADGALIVSFRTVFYHAITRTVCCC